MVCALVKLIGQSTPQKPQPLCVGVEKKICSIYSILVQHDLATTFGINDEGQRLVNKGNIVAVQKDFCSSSHYTHHQFYRSAVQKSHKSSTHTEEGDLYGFPL